MSIGVVHWQRSASRHPTDGGLYLCYDENIHHWWIGIWTPPGRRNSDGDLMEIGWVRGSDCTHWARLPTPQDSICRPTAREERSSSP